jgi:large subunit ribosomal protein L5
LKFEIMLRLKEKYNKETIPAMMEKYGYKSVMAVPRIEKVVVNIGFGRQAAGKTGEEQKKIQQAVLEDLALICGQVAFLTKAKKSISTFKTRQGMPLGAAVTLRGKRMYDFLERLINIALPRSRDFKGIDSNLLIKTGTLA